MKKVFLLILVLLVSHIIYADEIQKIEKDGYELGYINWTDMTYNSEATGTINTQDNPDKTDAFLKAKNYAETIVINKISQLPYEYILNIAGKNKEYKIRHLKKSISEHLKEIKFSEPEIYTINNTEYVKLKASIKMFVPNGYDTVILHTLSKKNMLEQNNFDLILDNYAYTSLIIDATNCDRSFSNITSIKSALGDIIFNPNKVTYVKSLREAKSLDFIGKYPFYINILAYNIINTDKTVKEEISVSNYDAVVIKNNTNKSKFMEESKIVVITK